MKRTIIEMRSGIVGPYVVIKARNGEILLTSESYSSNEAVEEAVAGLRQRFLFAKTVDRRGVALR